MSDELGEIIREILRIASDVVVGKIQLKTAQYRTDKVIKKIEDWHIQERKKWALGLLKTIIEEGDCLPDGVALEVVTQIRKEIEEG